MPFFGPGGLLGGEFDGAEFLDPVVAAGLGDIGLAAALHLHRDVAGADQAGRHGGDVLGRRLQRRGRLDGVALDQVLGALGAKDHLGERNLAVGAERDLELRVPAVGAARDAGRHVDVQKPGKYRHGCLPLIPWPFR